MPVPHILAGTAGGTTAKFDANWAACISPDSNENYGVGGAAVIGRGKMQVFGAVTTNSGINVTGNGGFFNGANKFGVDLNAGVTRMYASGPDSSTRGGYQFRVTDSTGVLDMVAVDIDANGNMIPTLATSAPTLSGNRQMVFTLTSDTNLRISVRGGDGTTRVHNLTLA
jgi:hypothetical protein